MRILRIVLVIVAVACIGVALSYPIRYHLAQKKNDSSMESLAEMRLKVRQGLDGLPEDIGGVPFGADTAGTGDTGDAEGQAGAPETGEASLPEQADAETGAGGVNLPEAFEPGTEDGEAVPPEAPETGAGEDADAPSEMPDEATKDEGAAPPEAPETGAGEGADTPSEMPDEATKDGEATPAEAIETGAEEGADAPSEKPDEGTENGEAASSEASAAGEAERPEAPAGTGQADDVGAADTVQGQTVRPTQPPTPTPEPTREPNYWDLGKYMDPTPSPTPRLKRATPEPTLAPTPTPDRSIRKGPLPYSLKDKVELDEAAILPELKAIYDLNHDLVGWLTIPGTVIDYPVVQTENGAYYLDHDFYGDENINGQIILDPLCDPYTPSYNLVISGHHMKNGTMFGGLPQYHSKSYWEKHRFLEFDSLLARKIYVVFACFYSADYDEDETGFRYNAVIDYKMYADRWLAEIEENQLYDTGIERQFGDEFITLTTCDRARHRNGRFVVVARKIREGETFE